MDITIKGRIARMQTIRTQEGDRKYQTLVDVAAKDQYSMPSQFKLGSEFKLGEIGDEVTAACSIRSFVKTKTITNRDTGENVTYWNDTVLISVDRLETKPAAVRTGS